MKNKVLFSFFILSLAGASNVCAMEAGSANHVKAMDSAAVDCVAGLNSAENAAPAVSVNRKRQRGDANPDPAGNKKHCVEKDSNEAGTSTEGAHCSCCFGSHRYCSQAWHRCPIFELFYDAARHRLSESEVLRSLNLILRSMALADDSDINNKGCGRVALSRAAFLGFSSVVQRILNALVNPNQPGPDGRTALHWGAMGGEIKVVMSLLEAGADLCIIDRQGKLACDLAKNKVVISLLTQAKKELKEKRERENDEYKDESSNCLLQ